MSLTPTHFFSSADRLTASHCSIIRCLSPKLNLTLYNTHSRYINLSAIAGLNERLEGFDEVKPRLLAAVDFFNGRFFMSGH
jgi:hypothetical protein